MTAPSILTVYEKYKERGHGVRILSRTRIEVTDRQTGHVYRVTAWGKVICGGRLAEELASDRSEEDPLDFSYPLIAKGGSSGGDFNPRFVK